MPSYTAPLADMRFALYHVLDVFSLYRALPGSEELGADVTDAVLEEAAKFTGQVLAPLNRTGDEEGCRWDNGEVHSPKGFREAYRQFVDGGWSSLTGSTEYGGQGLPDSLGAVIKEMIDSANLSWGTYPLLSHGATDAMIHHGEDWQKEVFLPRIISGEWTGTMCLTEPHCGTDLGMLKTKAEPLADGSYALSGTKIFITAGEHDMTDNIVHLVLARLPDAPAGTKGISMFIVPKFKVGRDGVMGERNAIRCGSIEHKMGIKASATCVMNLDGAQGWLIGPPNRGLNCMFTMMNSARLAVGLQGLALIESSYQGALSYARDRLQMRSLSGPKRPDKPADPIIVHPDVRRMLLTQKAIAEGGRVLAYHAAMLVDVINRHPDQSAREQADELLSFLTPIVKAVLTELAVECTNHGVQVYGGHGYIREWGMEQYARDARITTIYEGTTQIQALDLLGRKVMQGQAAGLRRYLEEIQGFIAANQERHDLAEFLVPLGKASQEWLVLTQEIGQKAVGSAEEIGAAAVDYLMYSGYVALAYCWARSIVALDTASVSAEFKAAKFATARFYFARLLPRTLSHAAGIRAGADCLFALDEASFSLATA